jgi:hypothetical protein
MGKPMAVVIAAAAATPPMVDRAHVAILAIGLSGQQFTASQIAWINLPLRKLLAPKIAPPKAPIGVNSEPAIAPVTADVSDPHKRAAAELVVG